jgi:inner membrane protein
MLIYLCIMKYGRRKRSLDTITHTLFGITIYGAAKKDEMTLKEKRALLFTSIVGSQAPDSDIIVEFTEIGKQMSLMWHRGLTHSIFLVPLWAFLIYTVCKWIFKVQDRRLFYIGLLAVFIHDTSDLFNAWGTGYLEPFSHIRITFGTIPIIDFVFWGIFLIGTLVLFFKKSLSRPKVFRLMGTLMLLHLIIQSIQGFTLQAQTKDQYDQTALAATFIPGQFQLIGKKGNIVEISNGTIWTGLKKETTLSSSEKSDLTPLLKKNPKAQTILEWSPFVVIVDNSKQLGVFDPRFYRNGQSFVSAYIEKK